MKVKILLLIFFLAIFFTHTASGDDSTMEGIFDILDETVFDDKWNDTEMEYKVPPVNGCVFPNGIRVITRVRSYRKGDERKYVAYARSYSNCHKDRWTGSFGNTICKGDGCWVRDLVGGSRFYITEGVYNAQSNHTKSLIDRHCGGVVPRDWQPFYGNPNDPYDVEVENRGIIWGYLSIHFDDMSRIDGEYCIPDIDSLVIDGGSWYTLSAVPSKDGWWIESRGHDSLTTHEIKHGIIIVTMNVTTKWRYARINDMGEKTYGGTQVVSETFRDSTKMPRVISAPPNVSVVIVCHNNSVTPYSLIDVVVDKNVTSTTIEYKNKTYTYHYKTGLLTSEDEHVYFDFVNATAWLPDPKKLVYRRAGFYVIDAAPITINNINITCSDPYRTVVATDYDITIINSKPSDYISIKTIIAFLSFIGLFLFVALVAVRRAW